MNAVSGINPLEYLLLFLLGGGGGATPGLPPQAEDPVMLRAAPAECLFYASWAGSAEPDARSNNSTERLLAEPEVRAFLRRMADSITTVAQAGQAGQQPWAASLQELVLALRGSPGALFLSSIELNPNGLPGFRAGGLLRIENEQKIRALLTQLQAQLPAEKVSEVEIEGRSFTRIEFEQVPPLLWGIAGRYLVLGVGNGEVERVMNSARSSAPEWLKAARRRASVPRVASTTYVNLGASIQLALQATRQPQLEQVLSVLGLDGLQTLTAVNGLDERGCMTHTMLEMSGEPSGVLGWLENAPLDENDMEIFGGTTPVAIAFKIDAGDTFDGLVAMARQVQPEVAQQQLDALAQFEEPLEISVRDDLLGGLGDAWRLFVPPGPGGLATGWSLAIEVTDRRRLEQAQAALVTAANAALGGDGGTTITRTPAGRNVIHTVQIGQAGIPVAPSWCITDEELFVTVTPETMRSVLGRRRPLHLLIDRPGVRELIEERDSVAFTYVNTRLVAKNLLPIVELGLQALQAVPQAVSLDTSQLPSADSIIPHLLPTRFALRRTEFGAETVVHQTLPGGNGVLLVPVAVGLTLPAVAAARTAALRVQGANKLKQVGLAIHNHHDAKQAFPAAHNADGSGEPLLSWRVHILPYLGEEALYQEFRLDEAWNSPHNQSLIERMPLAFASPGPDAADGKTAFLGILGQDHFFVAPQPNDSLGIKVADIRDGTSNTIAAVEVPAEMAVPWTQPTDFTPDGNDLARVLGRHRGGFQVLLADGSVRFLAADTAQEVLTAMFTTAAGDLVPQ